MTDEVVVVQVDGMGVADEGVPVGVKALVQVGGGSVDRVNTSQEARGVGVHLPKASDRVRWAVGA